MSLLTAALLLPQTPPKGSIHGVVVLAGTNTPLADAEVHLIPNTSEDRENSVDTSTDNDGHFTMDVAPGTRQISVRLDGYFGAPKNGMPSSGEMQLVTVVSNRTTDITFSLVSGGGVTGMVYDPEGRIAVNATVDLHRILSSERIEQTYNNAEDTNERGEFRLTDVPPGNYYVSAEAQASDTPADAATGTRAIQAPTFFPGTIDWKQAVVVTVRPGEETSGVIIHLRTGIRASITGQIVDTFSTKPLPPATPPAAPSADTILIRAGSRDPRFASDGNMSIYVSPRDGTRYDGEVSLDDGEFEISDVLPGAYDILVSVGASKRNESVFGSQYTGPVLFGKATVDVRYQSVSGVRIKVEPGSRLRGQILLDDKPLNSSSSINITLQPDTETAQNYLFWNLTTATGPEGTFVFPSIPDGRYRVKVQNPDASGPLKANSYLSEILLEGKSTDDDYINVGAQSVTETIIRIRTDSGTVSGVLVDTAEKPVALSSVILIPSVSQANDTRRSLSAFTNLDGQFSLPGVASGKYLVFAWESPPKDAMAKDAGVNDSKSLGIHILVTPGGKVAIRVVQIPAKK